MFRYEVEFGVIDAIARFTTILKQKVGRAPITEKGDANVNGANQDSNSAKSGDGGGNSGAQNISAKEVLAAEQALDKVKEQAINDIMLLKFCVLLACEK